jgi:hypothetical protein
VGAEGDDGVCDKAEEAEPALFARVWKERKEALLTVLDLLALLVQKYKYCFSSTEEAEPALFARMHKEALSSIELVKQYLYFCTGKASKSRRR